ncbi:DUF885 domain-containing protein [Marinicella sp. S1101]|uniref:DUF885 domain-containing protein n=1 Tax=Marinicella marina TaxID=2996016 RepID=UPI002260F72A|nr:DUF885 domain-containing protein [Marinicella marina]MCX7552721.1 DUF885 domain-containing protein [Marinicella marina]MDJ1139970.1 DUF885 domain-containing protein [Marinicella marina]
MASRAWKFTKRTLLVALFLLLVFVVNLIWFRPFFINHFYEKIFVEFVWESPQTMTDLGIGFWNDQLDDNSAAANEKGLALLQKSYEHLLEYDRSELTGQAAISYDILKFFLQGEMDSLKYKDHGYSVTQRGGSYQGIINYMTTTHRIEDVGDAEDYLSRVSQIGRYFDNTLTAVRKEHALGILPPRFVIEKIIENLHNIRDPEMAENPLVKDFFEKVDQLGEVETAQKEQLKAQMVTHMEDIVLPAYDRYLALYNELLPQATTDAGVWKLPDGDAYYQSRIKAMTTTEYTAEELHQLGLAEVDRILSEMSEILSAQGYNQQTVGEAMRMLGEDPQFLYPDTDAGREQILVDYVAMIDEIELGMDAVFDIKPKADVVVKKVPEFRQKTAAGGSYRGPAPDGSRPGIFYANLYDIKATPKWSMRTLAYHEAVPGHHFQIAIRTELEGLPSFRNFIGFTAYSEGWALYAERLAWEQGYQQEPFSNLGRLQAELLRAVRLVVDTGIHHKRWSREQAIDYMASTTGMTMTDVVSEIERYIVWPGQALAYKVGMIKIMELRAKAKAALGDRYDIREFHNVVLKNGAVPLTILEGLVDKYIAEAV